jgi:hypothetical protein
MRIAARLFTAAHGATGFDVTAEHLAGGFDLTAEHAENTENGKIRMRRFLFPFFLSFFFSSVISAASAVKRFSAAGMHP